MNLRFFSFFFLLSFFFCTSAAQNVRVLLAELSTSTTIQMTEGHRGYVDGAERFVTPLGLDWPLSVGSGQIYAEGQALGKVFRLEPQSGLVYWDGQPYRGSLSFVADGNNIKVLNVLDLETYLRGVVPVEMAAAWPLEALKAQAIAARTYTLQRLDPAKLYDVCGTQVCQEYGGVSVEHSRSDQAVTETSGVVVTHGGEYARTVYHSDSGGVIASAEEVWGGAFPYLVSIRDADGRTPHRSWDLSLEPGRVANSLAARGHNVGTVSSFTILSNSPSGRVNQAQVMGSVGSVTLSGIELRQLLREWGLKSTRFSMTGALSVQGSGWGHGVGMSQYGARALAESGYNHLQILAFYYPYTEFQQHVFAYE